MWQKELDCEGVVDDCWLLWGWGCIINHVSIMAKLSQRLHHMIWYNMHDDGDGGFAMGTGSKCCLYRVFAQATGVCTLKNGCKLL